MQFFTAEGIVESALDKVKIIEERLKNLKYDWKVLFVGVDKNGTTWRKGE